MATLTQNWVAYATEIWDFGATKVTYYLEAKYSTQSQTNNNTTIQTRLRAELNYGYGSGYGYNFTCSYAQTVSGSNEWYLASEVITSGEATIPHENDGTKTITLNATATVNGLGKSSTLTATVDLPTIPRQSELVEKPVFTMSTDGNTQTFKVNIKKNNSSFYDVLRIKSSTGQITIKEVAGVTAGEHTYTFDSTERNKVFQAYGTETTERLYAEVETYTSQGGTSLGFGTNSRKYANAVTLNYTISTTISEMVDTVSNYNQYKPSGHINDTFIANLSKPRFTLTTTSSTGSFYGRTVSYKLGNNSISNPYTENSYTGQSFTFNATDGRKPASVTPNFTNIPYFTPTLTTTVKRTSPTGNTVSVNVTGTLYDGTGLINLLTPSLKFKYTESGGTEQEITIPLTINGNNFTGSATLTGLNYQKSMAWSSILTDRIGITANNGNTLPQGLPLYHGYRKNDTNYMNIYGELLINGKPINYYAVGEEIIIGYFKNGNNTKPIYRKVCYVSELPSTPNTTQKYDVGISNADFVVNCYGSCSNGNLINASRCDSAAAEIGAWYDTDTQRLTITVGRDRSSLSAYITVEYTKTTD